VSSDTEKLVNLLENGGVDASVGEHLKSTFDHEDIGDVIDHIQALQARIDELEAENKNLRDDGISGVTHWMSIPDLPTNKGGKCICQSLRKSQ